MGQLGVSIGQVCARGFISVISMFLYRNQIALDSTYGYTRKKIDTNPKHILLGYCLLHKFLVVATHVLFRT